MVVGWGEISLLDDDEDYEEMVKKSQEQIQVNTLLVMRQSQDYLTVAGAVDERIRERELGTFEALEREAARRLQDMQQQHRKKQENLVMRL
ncbi:MAG: hypothetical protein J6J86_09655 [Lachnospiraceae bacterium]|nr:hypothetical protein [Lachnospiraceae bacterium]